MQPSQPMGSRPARRPMIAMVLLAFAISACGTPEGATPTVQSPAAQGATAAQVATAAPPTSTPPATAAAQKPTAPPTQTGSAPQGQAAPTPIPACTFNAATGPEPQVPPLEAYVFSEPKVILTGQSIGIAEWLPDNQQVLITRADPTISKQAIELFNVQSNTVDRLAAREGFGAKPVWLDAEQAVAFADVGPQKQIVLRISRGQGAQVEDVVSDLASPYLAVKPRGQTLLVSSKSAREQPQVVNTAPGQRQMRPITPPLTDQSRTQQGEQNARLGWGPAAFQAAWSPDGKQIALYNETGFYVTDDVSGQICTVDLGMYQGDPGGKLWATWARWSPDGRFIALLTTIGKGLPLPLQ